mgnify:CR=1 FL=1
MKTAITLCQIPEALNGPFVFHLPLGQAFPLAAALGYDAVELFMPGPDAVPAAELRTLAAAHHLAIAAVGTGAGWKTTTPVIKTKTVNTTNGYAFLFNDMGFVRDSSVKTVEGCDQYNPSRPVPAGS